MEVPPREMKLFRMARENVNSRLGLQHFNEYHAYENSQMNKSRKKVLAHIELNAECNTRLTGNGDIRSKKPVSARCLARSSENGASGA